MLWLKLNHVSKRGPWNVITGRFFEAVNSIYKCSDIVFINVILQKELINIIRLIVMDVGDMISCIESFETIIRGFIDDCIKFLHWSHLISNMIYLSF